MRAIGVAETRYGASDARRGLGALRATSALVCITNVPIGTCVDTQCERQPERKRVRANPASICAERSGTGKRFANILHACKGIPPGSRQIGWRALSRAQTHTGEALITSSVKLGTDAQCAGKGEMQAILSDGRWRQPPELTKHPQHSRKPDLT